MSPPKSPGQDRPGNLSGAGQWPRGALCFHPPLLPKPPCSGSPALPPSPVSSWMVTLSRTLKEVSSLSGWLQRWHTKLTCVVQGGDLEPSISAGRPTSPARPTPPGTAARTRLAAGGGGREGGRGDGRPFPAGPRSALRRSAFRRPLPGPHHRHRQARAARAAPLPAADFRVLLRPTRQGRSGRAPAPSSPPLRGSAPR